jgi:hypothetical protein
LSTDLEVPAVAVIGQRGEGGGELLEDGRGAHRPVFAENRFGHRPFDTGSFDDDRAGRGEHLAERLVGVDRAARGLS